MRHLFRNVLVERLTYPTVTYLLILYLLKRRLYIERAYVDKKLLRLLKSLRGYQKLKITSTGVLILFYKCKVIKIPLGNVSKSSLNVDFLNYKKLRISDCANYVAYDLKKHDDYYEMERLESIVIENINVKSIANDLSQLYASSVDDLLDKNLFRNLSKIERLCGIDIPAPKIEKHEKSAMHGDLTKNNIMRNCHGSIVLIDLDRFTCNGLKDIDCLHFEVDRLCSEQGIDFFIYLQLNFAHHPKKSIFLTYLLYRVSQEHHDEIILPQTYYDGLMRTLEFLQQQ